MFVVRALLFAVAWSVALACDGFADLMGRLSVETPTPSRTRGLGFAAGGFRLQQSRVAHAVCGRLPTYRPPSIAGRFSNSEGFLWGALEAKTRSPSHSTTLGGTNLQMRSNGRSAPRVLAASVPLRIAQKPSHQVLVLNASYEPLSVISAPRALNLLWTGKASTVVQRATWVSAGGQHVDVPSVVSLRRYIKVSPRMPPLNRKTILMRDLGVCQYCGKAAENIDHVIPRSRGGGTTWENCVSACKHCNTRKGASYLKDMPGMKLKKQPGLPTALSWVHGSVWKIDPRWRPYVGELSWEDIEKKLDGNAKKIGKRKSSKRNGKNSVSSKGKSDAGASDEADSVIAAYTGGQ